MRYNPMMARGAPAVLAPPEAAAATLGRARAIVEFADQNPGLAFEAGLESIATEMRLALAGAGAVPRPFGGGGSGLGVIPSPMEITVYHRASDLQREALRRVVRHHERLAAEAKGPSLGEALQTALSVASSAVWIAMAFA